MKIILALGSNIGNRLSYIIEAIQLIKNQHILTEINVSQIYESKALLTENAPKTWDKKFINLAISGFSQLTPYQLLSAIKKIEQDIGRTNRGIWSPREIDIDILLYGDLVIKSPNLTIPHQEFLNRDFAYLPANDLYPDWQHPAKGAFYKKKLSQIIASKNISTYDCQIINKNINI
jgi:2-amino-4-hydroxy-6-hydroxymethyldihydropteridine diphosphokinase/dihydropteroate synthase